MYKVSWIEGESRNIFNEIWTLNKKTLVNQDKIIKKYNTNYFPILKTQRFSQQ